MARSSDPAARPLVEILLGFVGAILIIPLIFRVLGGLLRTGFVQKLLVEAAVVGATTLLTKEGVLDRLFGKEGGARGLLKTDAED